MSAESNPVLLYDGVCGLCNRFVQFVLRHDRHKVFRFAALQSEFAARVLERHGRQADRLDTVYLVIDYGKPGETIADRSDAALAVLRRLGGGWKALSCVLRLAPRPCRNWGYDQMAKNRYRMFGKYDFCPLPDVETRSRFLEV